ncbi:regulator [Streptomyces spongiicola]|uniref:Regulator n=1 Tax=Streptomyces spongiicola TaxID=1690221 RepID=A0A388T3K1_9ACTN|nr:regulator [Streptomyces spongiicola]
MTAVRRIRRIPERKVDIAEAATFTLEAYADTIVPGEKRWPGDRAVAGVSTGGGAVACGALDLLRWDATGIHDGLEDLASRVNDHARAYAEKTGRTLDGTVPPFVSLDYDDRVRLIEELTTPGHPEKDFWVLLSLFCNMAFDSAAHLHTDESIENGHPGLAAMGITVPDTDGLWRFRDFGYGRRLADLHPDTTPSGSPA